jgi:hypothetical protein
VVGRFVADLVAPEVLEDGVLASDEEPSWDDVLEVALLEVVEGSCVVWYPVTLVPLPVWQL